MSSALGTQVGDEGQSHYTDMKIQPMEYSMANNLNACQHTAIKYLSRYKAKNGKQDLLKAIHTIELLIELEYPEEGGGEGKSVKRQCEFDREFLDAWRYSMPLINHRGPGL